MTTITFIRPEEYDKYINENHTSDRKGGKQYEKKNCITNACRYNDIVYGSMRE